MKFLWFSAWPRPQLYKLIVPPRGARADAALHYRGIGRSTALALMVVFGFEGRGANAPLYIHIYIYIYRKEPLELDINHSSASTTQARCTDACDSNSVLAA